MKSVHVIRLSILVLAATLSGSRCQEILDEQCYAIGRNNTFNGLVSNLLFCGDSGVDADVNATFFKIDANKDSNVSYTELIFSCFEPFARKMFCKFDQNGDGLLSFPEFQDYLRQVDAFQMMDMSDSLALPEFASCSVVERLLWSAGYDVDNSSLQPYTDSSGNVNLTEFMDLYRSGINGSLGCRAGFDCSALPMSAESMFNAVDLDKNRAINFPEFDSSSRINECRVKLMQFYDFNGDDAIQHSEWLAFFSQFMASGLGPNDDGGSVDDVKTDPVVVLMDPPGTTPNSTHDDNDIGIHDYCGVPMDTRSMQHMLYTMSFCGWNPPDYEEAFHFIDENSDGLLSSAEFVPLCFDPMVFQVFCIFDVNRDNALDRQEFTNYVYSTDDFVYFSNPMRKDPPAALSLMDVSVRLRNLRIEADNESLSAFLDANMMIPLHSFYDIVHDAKSDVNPTLTCNNSCDSLPDQIDSMFTAADANGDGLLSVDELDVSADMQKWRNLSIAQYDFNRDQHVDFDEWRNFVEGFVLLYEQENGAPVSVNDTRPVPVENGSSGFDFNVCSFLPVLYEFSRVNRCKACAHENYDADSDGRWSKDELIKYLRIHGYERKKAWMLTSHGGLSKDGAAELHKSLPSRTIRKFRNRLNLTEHVDPSFIAENDDPLSLDYPM